MKFVALILTLALISLAAWADISYDDAYVRVAPPGAMASAGFVVLKNSSDKDVIALGAKADFAKSVELHTHAVKDGVMQMRKVDQMTIPAKGELRLKPHGNHLMFFDLKKELKAGDKAKIIFQLKDSKSEKTEELEVVFEAKDLNKLKQRRK